MPNGSRDRAATEAALQSAAVRLMERDGVLAGLNLNEVAAEAGVNRGLVYHHFGSRQELLRAALARTAKARFDEVAEGDELPFRARMVAFLRTMVRHRQAVQLATLLVADRDPSLRTMPLRAVTQRRLAADVASGAIDDGLDLDAVHTAVVSLTYGYVLYRERFADEIGVPVDDLDERVAAVADRMLGGLAP
ncbi:MAG TPA: helix-turn-helix domain-containing protein [Acidimicrobiales bacterium]|nr:helix-turn-helix domain-containing protein [Acidimicrobiales bacterium]